MVLDTSSALVHRVKSASLKARPISWFARLLMRVVNVLPEYKCGSVVVNLTCFLGSATLRIIIGLRNWLTNNAMSSLATSGVIVSNAENMAAVCEPSHEEMSMLNVYTSSAIRMAKQESSEK
jgi:hypothetical protein